MSKLVEQILRDKTPRDYMVDGAFMMAEAFKGDIDSETRNRKYQQCVMEIELQRGRNL